MPVDVRQKLCEDWGYALEFGVAAKNPNDPYDLVWALNQPSEAAAKMAALHLSDPARYPLQVEISKRMPEEADSPPEGTFARKADGTIIYKGSYTLPDSAPVNITATLKAIACTYTYTKNPTPKSYSCKLSRKKNKQIKTK